MKHNMQTWYPLVHVSNGKLFCQSLWQTMINILDMIIVKTDKKKQESGVGQWPSEPSALEGSVNGY